MDRRGGIELSPFEIEDMPEFVQAVEFERADGSRAVAYLSSTDGLLGKRKPLMVWFEGSGAKSVFKRWPQGLSGGLFTYLVSTYGDRFHVAVVEKRGVPFAGEVERRGSAEGASREYQLHATWDDRVADGCHLIDALLRHPNVDSSLVLAIGHSEGGDIAAGVAAMRDEVTNVAVFAGAGPCQLAELIMLARSEGREEGKSEEELEDMVAWHESEYRKILAAPDSVDDMFYGHSYRRWSSFARRPPVESLVAAHASIYIAQGTRDRAVPIESIDLVVVELMRHGRTDFTVKRYLGADHNFATPEDEKGDGILLALDAAVEWATSAQTSTAP